MSESQKKFRIKVEVIDGSGEKLDREYVEGIECGCFVILGIDDDGCKTAIHHASIMDIAQSISNDDDLMAASVIAKGMRDANQYTNKKKMKSLLSAFDLSGLGE